MKTLEEKLLKVGRGEGRPYIPKPQSRIDSMLGICLIALIEEITKWQNKVMPQNTFIEIHREIEQTLQKVAKQLQEEGLDYIKGDLYRNHINKLLPDFKF